MFGFDFNFDGNHDEVVAEALGVGHGLEGLFELPQAPGHQLRALADPGAGRVVPAPVPAGRRDPDQRLPGPHRRVRRRSDQRLLHRPAILGDRPRPDVPRRRSGASARSARNSSRSRDPRIVRPLAQAIASR